MKKIINYIVYTEYKSTKKIVQRATFTWSRVAHLTFAGRSLPTPVLEAGKAFARVILA